MKENQLTIIKEDGTEELCEILFTHFDQELKKNYVVFEVISTGEASAMEYFETNEEGGQLLPIESDDEWEMIEALLEDFFDDLENEEEEEGCDCGDDCNCGPNCGCH